MATIEENLEDNEIEEFDNIHNNESDPSFEPETCEEGGKDGVECDPNWNGERWICSTCGKTC